MTAEVCLMNRLAVVLAADSATTVTRWSEAGREERYFKGANKIFQLSDHQPIGLMIYDAADILSVPWEVVTKEFRKNLGSKSFNHVHEYAAEFFTFIDEAAWLFPAAAQKDFFLREARSAAFHLIFDLDQEDPNGENLEKLNDALDRRISELNELPLLPRIDPDRAADLIGSFRDEMETMVAEWLPPAYGDCLPKVATVGMDGILKDAASFIGCTGLVFAGFGDRDPFPAMLQYDCHGILAGNLVAIKGKEAKIDHSNPAFMSAFAQTAMSDTFTLGLSQDVYNSLVSSTINGLTSFGEEIVAASGGDASRIEDMRGAVIRATNKIATAVVDQAKRDHAVPMRSILAVLPVDEMSELAETLINLQSLKEKVTKPSETVGGPVDVAVITRGEGLVWIKRKHFFKPDQNARYLARIANTYK